MSARCSYNCARARVCAGAARSSALSLLTLNAARDNCATCTTSSASSQLIASASTCLNYNTSNCAINLRGKMRIRITMQMLRTHAGIEQQHTCTRAPNLLSCRRRSHQLYVNVYHINTGVIHPPNASTLYCSSLLLHAHATRNAGKMCRVITH